LPASSSGVAGAAAAGVDVRQLPDGQLHELHLRLTLDALEAEAADPKGKKRANEAAEALQQQVKQELQRRQAAHAGTDANRQARPLSQGPASAVGDDDHLMYDEQLARALQVELDVDDGDDPLAAALAALDAATAPEAGEAHAADAACGPAVEGGDKVAGGGLSC